MINSINCNHMKILQINSHYNQGGAGKIVAYIHEGLQKDGVESFVAYGRGPERQGNLFRFDNLIDIYWSALMSRITGLNGFFNVIATRRLIKYIDTLKPDLIHLHNLHGYYLNFRILFDYLNKSSLPCVWTFHDCHAFVGNCGYFLECRKWENGCGRCPHLRAYPSSWLFDNTRFMWNYKKALFTKSTNKVIVSPSDWLTSEAKQSFFSKYDCRTINNGIDVVNSFYPRDKAKCRKKYGFSMEDKVVLGISVGYDDPRKGVGYIIETAKALEKEAKVILIGWENKNRSLIDGLTNVITLPVIRDTDVLAEYYTLSDVFVLPSLAENYATVSLEAMACGTPVVGFAVGGIPEQLQENKGIVVPQIDKDQFINAVKKALSSENGLLRGNELSKKIADHNSIDEMVGKYKETYYELLH